MNTSTWAIHGGFGGDSYSGAAAVPIYQTVSYAYKSARELAEIFAGSAPGYIYTRIANPTTTALELRLAELEEGVGCVATASGMAAISSVVMSLVESGTNIIAANGIFGGTVSLFENTLGPLGIETRFVDAGDTEQFEDAIDDKTRLIFVETIANPRMDVPDIPAVSAVARRAGVPLVVDNTVTTPILFKPGNFGADVVVHSTSKYINGHGTAIGGAIIDAGNYDWSKGPFKAINKLSERAGRLAFLANLRNLVYRDLGGCPAPMNSFLMLQGIETLQSRMAIHCENAMKLAGFLQSHPDVSWVNYPGLAESRFNGRVVELFGGRASALLTFGLRDEKQAFKFIDSLRLAKNMANLGDAKTLVIHPASTIFHEFTGEEKKKMGVGEDVVRVSVGIEDFEDLKKDFEQAIKKSKQE
ncbi:MAG: O-acetylhomoserine aminocarboxypropyltransferase/cysteine synthase family protein [Planctomycetota bacterium]|jgi:O-acetylhomoserine (thiol)-lyase